MTLSKKNIFSSVALCMCFASVTYGASHSIFEDDGMYGIFGGAGIFKKEGFFEIDSQLHYRLEGFFQSKSLTFRILQDCDSVQSKEAACDIANSLIDWHYRNIIDEHSRGRALGTAFRHFHTCRGYFKGQKKERMLTSEEQEIYRYLKLFHQVETKLRES